MIAPPLRPSPNLRRHPGRAVRGVALLWAGLMALTAVPLHPARASSTNATPGDLSPVSPATVPTVVDTNAPAPAQATTNAPQDEVSAASSERESSRSRRSDRRRNRGSADEEITASTSAPNNGTGFDSFQMIPERNIFNANRSARSSRGPREPERKAARVDTFALVGAMSYSKGDFAFFDGSSSEFRRVLKPGDSIAGFSLRAVGRNSVQLESDGKTLELAIGSHLRREEEGEWRVVAEAAPASFASSGSGSRSSVASGATESPSGSGGTTSADSGGGGADDILQRLMKKREQELK